MAELEFRDGARIVPDYMETMMAGLPLHKLTYAEAIDAMNAQAVQGIVDRSFDKILGRHFQENQK